MCGCDPAPDPAKNTEQNIEESKGRGRELAKALENYKSQFGHYPASLVELTEKLGVTVECPTVAVTEWDYYVDSDGGFYSLRFCMGASCYPNYRRTSAVPEWVHDG